MIDIAGEAISLISSTKGRKVRVSLKMIEAGKRGNAVFRGIEIIDVVCTGAKTALLINGLPEMPLEQLYVHNVTAAAEQGVVCHYAKQLVLEQMDLHVKDGPLVTLHKCEQVELIRL